MILSWTFLIDSFVTGVISEERDLRIWEVWQKTICKGEDLKPITKFHFTGITPGECMCFNEARCSEFAEVKLGKKCLWNECIKESGFVNVLKYTFAEVGLLKPSADWLSLFQTSIIAKYIPNMCSKGKKLE